ncbi:hypothetical protein J6590_072412 [Homalodisca vitripennis]|nr:hypothetical protein J6590_072412 [Homalodisca vitripennis]
MAIQEETVVKVMENFKERLVECITEEGHHLPEDVQNGDPWTLDEGVAKQEDEWILFHDMLSGVDVPEEVAICWPDFVRVDVMGPCEDGVTVDRTNKHQTLPSR